MFARCWFGGKDEQLPEMHTWKRAVIMMAKKYCELQMDFNRYSTYQHINRLRYRWICEKSQAMNYIYHWTNFRWFQVSMEKNSLRHCQMTQLLVSSQLICWNSNFKRWWQIRTQLLHHWRHSSENWQCFLEEENCVKEITFAKVLTYVCFTSSIMKRENVTEIFICPKNIRFRSEIKNE